MLKHLLAYIRRPRTVLAVGALTLLPILAGLCDLPIDHGPFPSLDCRINVYQPTYYHSQGWWQPATANFDYQACRGAIEARKFNAAGQQVQDGTLSFGIFLFAGGQWSDPGGSSLKDDWLWWNADLTVIGHF